MFSCEFCKIFDNTFFIYRTASDKIDFVPAPVTIGLAGEENLCERVLFSKFTSCWTKAASIKDPILGA